jgi:hypothetical protein
MCKEKYPENSEYFCKCHEKMGNDFWFLPLDRCLYEKKEIKSDANQS